MQCYGFFPAIFEVHYAVPMALMLYQWVTLVPLQLQLTTYWYLSCTIDSICSFAGSLVVTIDFMLHKWYSTGSLPIIIDTTYSIGSFAIPNDSIHAAQMLSHWFPYFSFIHPMKSHWFKVLTYVSAISKSSISVFFGSFPI